MKRPAIIDTNVLVAGLLTSVFSNGGGNNAPSTDGASARILDGMLSAAFPFVLSVDLLTEYRRVLLSNRLLELHKLSSAEIDQVLTEIALNGMITDVLAGGLASRPASGSLAPDSGDQHLWDLMTHQPRAVLVSADQRLLEHPPENASVVSPRTFVALAP